jgi:hypothetical protein
VPWEDVDLVLPYLPMAVWSLLYANGVIPSAGEAIALARSAADGPT